MRRLFHTLILGALSCHHPSSWVNVLIILRLSNRPIPPGKVLLHFLIKPYIDLIAAMLSSIPAILQHLFHEETTVNLNVITIFRRQCSVTK